MQFKNASVLRINLQSLWQHFRIITLFLVISCPLISNNVELDSLYQRLRTDLDEETIAKVHGRICWLTINSDIKASQAHMDTARSIFIKLEDKRGIAVADYKDAVIQRRLGNYELALDKMDKYMSYMINTNDERGVNNGIYQKGVLYQLQGNYDASLKEYYKLIEFYRKMDDIKGLGFTLNSIGIVYKNLKKYDDARDVFEECIEILEGTEYDHDLANAYSNLGSIKLLESNYNEALLNLEKSQEINFAKEDNWAIGIGYSKVGSIYKKMGDLEKAEAYFIKALDIQNEHEYKERSTTLRELGDLKLMLQDYSACKSHLSEALSLNLSLDDLCEIHLAFSKLYKEIGNEKKALHHHENYVQYNDSLRGIESIKDINRLQYQFESSKKDNEIIKQNLVIQEQENKLLQKEARSNRSIFLAILSVLGMLSLFIYSRQKQKAKNVEIERLEVTNELTKLESLIEGEEKERKRLAQDLHDGINGDLSVIKYNLVTIQSSENLHSQRFNSVVNQLDNAIANVRSISHDLAPPSMKNFSLEDTISDYCSKLNAGHLDVVFQKFGVPKILSEERKTALFRIVQELLNNSMKHANASEILVQLFYHTDSLNISVEDNGVGYDPDTESEGLGLSNIKSRAQFLKAEIIVESTERGAFTSLVMNL